MAKQLIPMHDNVVVRPKKAEEKTKGGLILPEETQERDRFAQMEGELVAVSAGAFGYNYPEWPDGSRKPQVGDSVMFARYQATRFDDGSGDELWLMKDTAIAGVWSDGE